VNVVLGPQTDSERAYAFSSVNFWKWTSQLVGERGAAVAEVERRRREDLRPEWSGTAGRVTGYPIPTGRKKFDLSLNMVRFGASWMLLAVQLPVS